MGFRGQEVIRITPFSQARQKLLSACKGKALGQSRNVRTFKEFWVLQMMPWSLR